MKIASGDSVGRYHILEPLGEGGMAAVFKAYDTRLEREVAIKFLRTELFGSAVLEQLFKRFEREAKALARLSHFHIVKIHDFGEHEGTPYLVMEYVPGGTLKSRMGKPVPWQEALGLLLPVARALEYAHQHGVLHRDVKPSNILITEGGEPLLSDFGIAKILETSESQGITGTGVGIGTPEYMAPEQGLAKEVDARTDVYALGIVLYEMLTGRKPYTADTPTAVLIKQVHDPLPDPRGFTPDIPAVVERVLFKALAKQPENRYASMAEFARAMEHLLKPEPQEESPAEPTVAVEWSPRVEEAPPTRIAGIPAEKPAEDLAIESPQEEIQAGPGPAGEEVNFELSSPVEEQAALPEPAPSHAGMPSAPQTKKPLKLVWIAIPILAVAALAVGLALGLNPPKSAAPTPPVATRTSAPPSPIPTNIPQPTQLPAVQEPPPQEVLRIGIMAPMSGDVAAFGASTEQGVQLAVDQWNERGGVLGMRIEPLYADDRCNPDGGVEAANRLLIEEKVRFLIGGVCSMAAIPEAEIANEHQVIQITTAATNTAVTVDESGNTRPFTFRTSLVDPFQGLIAARFAFENLKAKRVFIVFEQDNPYGMMLTEAFSAHFKELGGEYTGTISYTAGQDDFSMIIKKIQGVKPDLIYLPGYYNLVNQFIAQAREQGIKTTFLGSDGWDSPGLDLQIASGSFFTSHYWIDDPRPEVREFRDLFGERYRNEQGDPIIPDAIAVLSYDAVNMLLRAIMESGTVETEAVRASLGRLSFPGVTGIIHFNDQHNPIKPAVILAVTPEGLRLEALLNP